MSMLVLPLARPPGGSRPARLWITVFGTGQLAVSGSPGCDRTVPVVVRNSADAFRVYCDMNSAPVILSSTE